MSLPDPTTLPLPTKLMEGSEPGMILIDVWEVLELMYPHPDGHYNHPEYNYMASGDMLKAYLDKHNLHYYADVKEDFSTWKGVEAAKAKGCVGVILENLS